jgi:hypothetical protein
VNRIGSKAFMGEYDAVTAIGNSVAKRISFDKSQGSLKTAFETGKGNCFTTASAVNSIARCLGYQAQRQIRVEYNSPHNSSVITNPETSRSFYVDFESTPYGVHLIVKELCKGIAFESKILTGVARRQTAAMPVGAIETCNVSFFDDLDALNEELAYVEGPTGILLPEATAIDAIRATSAPNRESGADKILWAQQYIGSIAHTAGHMIAGLKAA